MPINLKELAKICSVDISTVSRALRDDARVKQSTKEHIKELAVEYGYLPNLAARNLATGKTNQVALLVNRLSTNLEMEIAKNLSFLLLEKDIDVVLLQHFDEKKIYIRQLQRFRKNQFDAAIIIPGNQDVTSSIINQFTPAEIPTVIIDRYPENAKIPVITTNNFEASKSLGNMFINDGVEAILPLFGSHNDVEKKRFAGVNDIAKSRKIKMLTQKDLKNKIPYQKILIIGSNAAHIQKTYEEYQEQLVHHKVFAGCFDFWGIDSTPYESVLVCLQDFNKITQLALETIFTPPAQLSTITHIDHKTILAIKHCL